MGSCCDFFTQTEPQNNPQPKGLKPSQVQMPSSHDAQQQRKQRQASLARNDDETREQEYKRLQQAIAQRKTQLDKLKYQTKGKTDRKQRLGSNITELQQTIRLIGDQIIKTNSWLSELAIKQERLHAQYQGIKLKGQQNKSDNHKDNSSIIKTKGLQVTQLDNQIRSEETVVKRLKTDIETAQSKKDKYQQEQIQRQKERERMRQQLQRETNKAKDILEDLQKEKETAQIQLKQQQLLNNDIIKGIDATKRQLQQVKPRRQPNLKPIIPRRHPKNYFVGEVLSNQNQIKQFLLQTLEQRLNQQITWTRLVYRYDPLNRTNFHQYIDNIPNLVVLIELSNGVKVGAWTEGGFKPKTASDKDGLLLALTQGQWFEPTRPNVKAVTYDDYFLIFGNSELRIKSGDIKVFSNFGINNSYYDSRGRTVDIMLGCGSKRQTDMLACEIFQLKFAP